MLGDIAARPPSTETDMRALRPAPLALAVLSIALAACQPQPAQAPADGSPKASAAPNANTQADARFADLMPHMDDEDSSSAGLPDDQGPGIHELEVDAPNLTAANKMREAVEALAFDLDVLVEFESDE